VWLGDGDKTVAADVIDFKTDALPPGDEKALAERTEHYRPQLEAYRMAVARLARLPAECIATRLVFTGAGRVIDV
jgi:ATP-dependent helicase/nuclease subunit A